MYFSLRFLWTQTRHKHGTQKDHAVWQQQEGDACGGGSVIRRSSRQIWLLSSGAEQRGADWSLLLGGGVEWRGLCICDLQRNQKKRKQWWMCVWKEDQSWSLTCSNGRYYVWHNNNGTSITSPSFSSSSDRVAVYLDCPGGTLSYYRVSSDTLIHLHTFNTTFTEALYPGFRFYSNRSGSTVSLCSL